MAKEYVKFNFKVSIRSNLKTFFASPLWCIAVATLAISGTGLSGALYARNRGITLSKSVPVAPEKGRVIHRIQKKRLGADYQKNRSKLIQALIVSKGEIQSDGRSPRSTSRRSNLSRSRLIKKSLDKFSKKYRNGGISKRELWSVLDTISSKISRLPKRFQVRVLQSQAQLLMEARLPVSAAILAKKSIAVSDNPLSVTMNRSWKILFDVSVDLPIHNLMESLSFQLELKDKDVPIFGSDWFYYVGNSLVDKGEYAQAIKAYKKVTLVDRYYFPAKFHESLAYIQKGDMADAEAALKKILFSTSQDLSQLDSNDRFKMRNMARLALGRIYYEKGEFEKSFRSYRRVDKDSAQFYDALFEQSWAFFMGGYPNHALGSLYSVHSPFFAAQNNPESKMLEALVYFWMCRYDESRAALTAFEKDHKKNVEGLSYFLDRSRLDPESAYELFENYIAGVSAASLGMSRELLTTAASQDGMMQVRDQYASVIAEKQRIQAKGIYGSIRRTNNLVAELEKWQKSLRASLGQRFLHEITMMRDSYASLHEQAQFLEIELLMSEKDHLLGKELHGSSKMIKVAEKRNLGGWGKNAEVSWSGSDLEEYWWDELGFYIYSTDPKCHRR